MQKQEKYVLVEYTCDLYLPGVPYRYNWVGIDGKEILIAEDTGKKNILHKLKELGGKRCRDFQIKTVSELTRAEYFKLKTKVKIPGVSCK